MLDLGSHPAFVFSLHSATMPGGRTTRCSAPPSSKAPRAASRRGT